MKLLNNNETKYICGATFLSTITGALVAVEVYNAPASIAQNTGTYNQWGSAVGEAIFNVTHPDPLGQMTYTAADFAPAAEKSNEGNK